MEQQFYETRRNFQTYGAEGLIDRLLAVAHERWFIEEYPVERITSS